MIVFGVALIIVGAGFAAAAVVGGWGAAAHPVNFGIATVSNWSSAAVFLAGMASMLVLLLGVWLVQRASRRRARNWRENRRAGRNERGNTATADDALPPPPPSEGGIVDPYVADGATPAQTARREHTRP